MTTISATTSTTSVSLAQLITGSYSEPQTAPAANANSNSTPAPGSADSYGAAAFVTLSEQAKQAAATKVVSDQAAVHFAGAAFLGAALLKFVCLVTLLQGYALIRPAGSAGRAMQAEGPDAAQ